MKRSIRSRFALLGAAMLVLALALGLTAGTAAAKKKSRTFEKQVAVNAGIPQDAATGPSTPLLSQITVPKKFKGKVVGDVNVTAIQTTGLQAGAAQDLTAKLTAPSGQTLRLWAGYGNQSIGPWTLDDDTSVGACNSANPVCTPPFTLIQPFAGTSNLTFTGTAGTGELAAFDGSTMRGTWTFKIFDQSDAAQSSTLDQWGLKIKAAKPVAE
jgi:subtilisin-like proprotein convertase family protein